MNNLLEMFGNTIFTVSFMWVVIAATITMEVLKWTVLPKDMNSKIFPYVVLGVCAVFVLLKTTFSDDWREFTATLLFTIMMADFLYTYCGQYIVQGIIWLFKRFTGNIDTPKP